ncbi:hypothetical protein DYI37_09690 [Fulvimarina endophytica]|uniref:Uncharacterized protein n=1 Tax=Fulvimarina endophytica TaxID=2293836 RepID=A0A371X262_9HYPH|nr:hypothetical protein DYI37_09690 [Fulvimarina endophytica]
MAGNDTLRRRLRLGDDRRRDGQRDPNDRAVGRPLGAPPSPASDGDGLEGGSRREAGGRTDIRTARLADHFEA